jgi:predicted small secreted protein
VIVVKLFVNLAKEAPMKLLRSVLALAMAISVTACGTLGGAMSGAGEDLKAAGDYVRSVGR